MARTFYAERQNSATSARRLLPTLDFPANRKRSPALALVIWFGDVFKHLSDPQFVLRAVVEHTPNSVQRCSDLVGSDPQRSPNLFVRVVATKKAEANRPLKLSLRLEIFNDDCE